MTACSRERVMEALRAEIAVAMEAAYGAGHGCSRDRSNPNPLDVQPEQTPFSWLDEDPRSRLSGPDNGWTHRTVTAHLVGKVRLSGGTVSVGSIRSQLNELEALFDGALGHDTLAGLAVTILPAGEADSEVSEAEGEGVIDYPIEVTFPIGV